MFKAYKLPNGKYRVQVIMKDENGHTLYKNGKRDIRSITDADKKEAIRRACELAAKKYSPAESENELIPDLTVDEAIQEYIDDNKNRLAPSTVRGYRIKQRTCLQSIKDKSIKSLLAKDIQKAVSLDSVKLSRKSIKDAVGLLRRVLTLNNKILNFKCISLPTDVSKEIKLPKVEDVLKAVHNSDLEVPCLLAMWHSLRISEIRGLKYSDVYASQNTYLMSIHRTKIYLDGKDIIRDKTKTKNSKRVLVISSYLYNMIMSLPHDSEDDFIITSGYNYIYKKFKKCWANSKKYKGMTFHKLRHIFASTLNDLGIDDDYIQKLGGWSNNYIMKSVYTQTSDDKEKEFQKIIDDYYINIIKRL